MFEATAAQEFTRCIALWLQWKFPRHTAKEAARALGVSPHTTKKWLEQRYPPANRHLLAMVARWKWPFVHDIFQPLAGRLHPALERLEELKSEMHRLERELKESASAPEISHSLESPSGRKK